MIDSADLARLRIRREEAGRPGPRRWRRWLMGAVAGAVVAAGAVGYLRGRPVPVEVVRVAVPAAPGAGGAAGLTANGYVVARRQASVSSKLPGRLAELAVEEGDRVEAGQVVARLEAAEFEAMIRQAEAEVLTAQAVRLEAEARLLQAGRELERARALYADSLLAARTVQDAETAVAAAEAGVKAAAARVEAARAVLAAARANLENTLIRAPFDGTILRKDAEVGEVVAPAVAGGGLTRGAVVTMADLSTLEVEVDVNEAYIAQIRAGQPARIVLDAYPGEEFPGHVRQVVPTADRQRATVLVRVAIDRADARILPEMGARVVFVEEAAVRGEGGTAPIYVPDGAVRNEGGEDVVWVVVEGRARRRPVSAGPVTAGSREIRTGLGGGELVIVDPPEGLTEGARVRPAEPPE